MSEEALQIENSRLKLYFKHIDTLEGQYSQFLDIVPLEQFS